MRGQTGRSSGWRVLMVAVALWTVVGCATGPAPLDASAIDSVPERERKLQALQGWQVQGRLGAWSDQTSVSAAMLWRDRPDGYDVRLVAPLGLGTLNVRQRSARASVRRGNRTLAEGEDAGRLLQQVLGLESELPMRPLSDWLLGLPGAGAQQVQRDAQGRLVSWRYRDAGGTNWLARIKRYGSFGGLSVPRLITARGGQWRLRVLLEDWQPALPSTGPGRLTIPRRGDA